MSGLRWLIPCVLLLAPVSRADPDPAARLRARLAEKVTVQFSSSSMADVLDELLGRHGIPVLMVAGPRSAEELQVDLHVEQLELDSCLTLIFDLKQLMSSVVEGVVMVHAKGQTTEDVLHSAAMLRQVARQVVACHQPDGRAAWRRPLLALVRRQLARLRVDPDARRPSLEPIRRELRFLDNPAPYAPTTTAQTARARALVAQLGRAAYRTRQAAERGLAELGPVALAVLESSRDHADLEVRRRVRALIVRIRARQLGRLLTVKVERVAAGRVTLAGADAAHLPTRGAIHARVLGEGDRLAAPVELRRRPDGIVELAAGTVAAGQSVVLLVR